MRRARLRVLVQAFLVVAAVVGPVTAGAQEEVVRLGDLNTISNAGLYIAVEKGYHAPQCPEGSGRVDHIVDLSFLK